MPTTSTQPTARELMRSPVITLPPDAGIEEALALFEDEHISGLPIVDEADKVVGMLTEHDVARADHLRKDGLETGRDLSFAEESETMEEQQAEIMSREDYGPETLGRTTVRDWMNPKVVGLTPGASLQQVCQLMRRESIHRVLVLDRCRLVGIITSSDVVAWLAEHG
jgi:CBS domain-containing protein